MIWAAFPIAALALLIGWSRAKSAGWREAVLIGATIWGAVLVVITEVLSLFTSITRPGLAVAWLIVGIVAWFGFYLARQKAGEKSREGPREPVEGLSKISIGLIGLLGLILFCIAITAPPNTWDAMTYHMGRVIHWAQNQSVAHYPTNILRQVQLNPGAEFVILHLQVLTNGDRLANLPQWLAMIGCVAGASVIAGRLGAGPSGQALSAVACATLPMGILQSTSAQNDYVEAFWLVCTAWCLLELVQHPVGKRLSRLTWMFGAGLGLAILTKATGYLFAAPLGLWFAVHVLRTRPTQWWRQFGAVALVILLLNLGHGLRNQRVFGSPLGPAEEVGQYSNAEMGPRLLASNVLRNLALHANVFPGGLQTPVTNLTARIILGMGADPHDPRTTLAGTSFGVEERFNHEDSAGNGLHLVLIFISIVVLARRSDGDRACVLLYSGACVAGFLLFCGYLRWQPWHSRLHLPLFVLASPLIGCGLAKGGRPIIGVCAGCLLLVGGVYPLFYNHSRPVFGSNSVFRLDRNEIYYLTRHDVREGHLQLADYAREKGCMRIGLAIGSNEWEYPLWALLNGGRVDGPYRFDHVNVTNATRNLAGGEHRDPRFPDCITTMQIRDASEVHPQLRGH